MKKLIFLLATMCAAVAIATNSYSQTKIYNPNLPQGLIFQWSFSADEVDPSWSNDVFSIARNHEGIEVYYGAFHSIADAMSNTPNMELVSEGASVVLVPFFNQHSLSVRDAMLLAENWNNQRIDQAGEKLVPSESISYSVKLGTYESLVSSFDEFDESISFEVQPNLYLSYSVGNYATVEAAEAMAAHAQSLGYLDAEVNKYCNGQSIAGINMQELYAFVEWIEIEK